jgi:hypothetical protein
MINNPFAAFATPGRSIPTTPTHEIVRDEKAAGPLVGVVLNTLNSWCHERDLPASGNAVDIS